MSDTVIDKMWTEDISITLKGREWGAVATLLNLALEAGCPAQNAREAYEKVAEQLRQHRDLAVLVPDDPTVTVTAQAAIDVGNWLKFCEFTGLSEWAVNEGMDTSTTFSLTHDQYRQVFQ